MTAVPFTDFDAERDRLARLTRKGIGMPVAGMLYWLATAAILDRFGASPGLLIVFFLTGAVFPVGVVVNRWLGGDLFAKSPSLTPLGLMLAAVQLFYWPVIVVVVRAAPAWTPYVMGVLFGSHFLPYAWLYRSRGYAVLAAAPMVVLTGAVLLAGDPLFGVVPLLAAACYAGAVALLWREVAPFRRAA